MITLKRIHFIYPLKSGNKLFTIEEFQQMWENVDHLLNMIPFDLEKVYEAVKKESSYTAEKLCGKDFT
jgi:hypothetical protein